VAHKNTKFVEYIFETCILKKCTKERSPIIKNNSQKNVTVRLKCDRTTVENSK
jgi:hypothetical protein